MTPTRYPHPATGPLLMTTRPPEQRRALAGYLAAVGSVLAVTALIALIPGATHVANISLLYLAGVIACGLYFGSRPAMLAAMLACLTFNFCFVQPRQTLTVANPAEWLALLMFLLTAAVTGHLTAQLQDQADEARRREQEAIALKQVSWSIASQTSTGPAIAAVLQPLIALAGATAAVVVGRDDDGRLYPLAAAGDGSIDAVEPTTRRAITYVLQTGTPIAWDNGRHLWDQALSGPARGDAVYVPLLVEHQRIGALVLHIPPVRLHSPNARRLIETMANHAAVILERDRLMQAEMKAKALAEADRLKTALLAMVSHDFRSPLASIKASAASVLSAGPAMDEAARSEMLTGVIQQTDRLDRMVGNILALSRLEADAWRPQTEPALVAEVIEAGLAGFTAAENRRVAVHLADPLLEARLDPVQIAQVIRNLVENALKYTPEDQPVEVRAQRAGDDLVITVLDRGPGIAAADADRIFARFYRAPGLPESAVPGLGIGLAICKGLVEAHGGTLTAGNRDGGGACFRVSLPMQAKEA